MKLVSTVWVSTSLSKSDYLQGPCICNVEDLCHPAFSSQLCYLQLQRSLRTKYCSWTAPGYTERTSARVRAALRTRTHARTHAHAHITEVSLVGPRLALSPEVGVCVLCDRNVVLFLDKPLSGALERPRGRRWGTCDPHLPQQGCFSQASPLGVALKAEKVPYLVPYVPQCLLYY